VGTGFVGGQAHAPSFKLIPSSELAALMDTDEGRVKTLAEKLKAKYYLDYGRMLEDPKVDAVVIAVPTPYHVDMALEAIRRGKHVLCEMPLAPRVSDLRRIGAEAERAGVTLMPDLNFRFTPNYLKVKELIEKREVGEPSAVNFEEFIPIKDLAAQWPAGSWAWDVERSGGYPDFTLSVWSIDLVRWLLNLDIAEVTWKSRYVQVKEYGGIYAYNTMGLLSFASGAIGSLHYGSLVAPAAGKSRLDVFGDKAFTLNAVWSDSVTLVGDEPSKKTWALREGGPKVWGHYQIDEHFVQCVLGKQEPRVTVEDAVKAQEVASKMVAATSKT